MEEELYNNNNHYKNNSYVRNIQHPKKKVTKKISTEERKRLKAGSTPL